MNKKFLLILIAGFYFSFAQAQEYSFGVKGGANYNIGGEITSESSGGIFTVGTYQADSKIGFHGGVFFQLKFGKILIRPEAYYNTLETEFPFPSKVASFSVDRLSIPLLVGYNIYGPIDIYAGPAYQSVITSTLEGTQPTDQEIVVQNSPLSAQAGVKFNIGRFELDLRYDHSLATKEPQDIDIRNGEYGINLSREDNDMRLNQILFSVAFKIGDSEKAGRRRGGNCYF
ncbi:outer membrane beta-barrel protein [Salegentibacter chungangensis]|uniref:Outer membrane beta-barrel protein n=1 Tax=Salegentibacter chungangensis TaxID=1335724 RepID=A0ABW3NWA8_9FLAO